MREQARRFLEYMILLALELYESLKPTIDAYHGDTGSFQHLQHPFAVSYGTESRPRRWPCTSFLCCLKTRPHPFPFHLLNFYGHSAERFGERRCSPEHRFGPIRIGDRNVRLQFPLLTGCFNDLARI